MPLCRIHERGMYTHTHASAQAHSNTQACAHKRDIILYIYKRSVFFLLKIIPVTSHVQIWNNSCSEISLRRFVNPLKYLKIKNPSQPVKNCLHSANKRPKYRSPQVYVDSLFEYEREQFPSDLYNSN